MQIHTFRLKPGQDLLNEIEGFIMEKKVEAGCILSSVGSLTHATLRLANRSHSNEYDGHFEILSLNGTVSTSGSHLHISISDGDGQTIGGHLVSGNKIYTTAEIVLAEFEEIVYKREFAEDSGYDELVVYKKPGRRPPSRRELLLQGSEKFLLVSYSFPESQTFA